MHEYLLPITLDLRTQNYPLFYKYKFTAQLLYIYYGEATES